MRNAWNILLLAMSLVCLGLVIWSNLAWPPLLANGVGAAIAERFRLSESAVVSEVTPAFVDWGRWWAIVKGMTVGLLVVLSAIRLIAEFPKAKAPTPKMPEGPRARNRFGQWLEWDRRTWHTVLLAAAFIVLVIIVGKDTGGWATMASNLSEDIAPRLRLPEDSLRRELEQALAPVMGRLLYLEGGPLCLLVAVLATRLVTDRIKRTAVVAPEKSIGP